MVPFPPCSSIFPIRIDVFTDDQLTRVVDTLVVDLTVLPKPSLDETAWFFAQSILGDAEVMGMGRASNRHFTGRVDLWSHQLLDRIHDSILSQLEAAHEAYMHSGSVRQAPVKGNNLQGMKRDHQADSNEKREESSAKKIKTEEVTEKAGGTGGANNLSLEVNKTDRSNAEATQSMKELVDLNNKLIPIRIRMSVHGTRIHDDILWDPSMADVVTPLTLAKAIGEDLKLAPEAVQAIAVSILEQIHGLELLHDGTAEDDEGGPPGDRSNTTAAWSLAQKVHITNVAHLVAQHRPKLR